MTSSNVLGAARRPTLALALCLLGCFLAAPAGAVQPRRPGADGWPPPHDRVIHPAEIEVPQLEPGQSALRSAHAGWRAFQRGRPDWKGTIDPATGSLDRAVGDGIPMKEWSDHAPDRADAVRRFLGRHAGLFTPGLETSGTRLVHDPEGPRPLGTTGAWFSRTGLEKDGLPVLGAGVTLGIRDGKVVLIAARAMGPVTASSVPTIDPAAAVAAASAHAGVELAARGEASLAFYPVAGLSRGAGRLRHHLIWMLSVNPPEAPAHQAHQAWVDARDGTVLAFFPESQNIGACSADPAQAQGKVIGGVRPNRADDPEVVRQMPFPIVNAGGTLVPGSINGRYPYPGGPASNGLGGLFFRQHCDNCTLPAEPTASAAPSGTIDFGTGGASSFPPVFGNGASTPADRAAYFHLQQMRLFLAKWDNAFFEEIDSFSNLADTCNAFSNASMLGFFAAGGNCRNTAEIRDVVYHELGHTWDRFDGNTITNGGLSEWKGDLMALLIGGDACVGESFRVTGGPTSVCSGVRDIDEKSPGRVDHPLTPAQCSTCATLTVAVNNCSGGVHCSGEIIGQASVHLLRNLLAGADDITGLPFAAGNPALPPEQARWSLERLLLAGGPPMQVFNPAHAGVSVYDAVALVDDDDANLANGTPRAAYYNPALAHHGLTESVLVTDAPACPPLADPAVTVTADRDAATGLPAALVEWVPAGGATVFDVYRNTRAGDGFVPLARDLAEGPFVDVGIEPGVAYRYLVAAVRRSGCAEVSPGMNVVPFTFTDPELTIQSAAAQEGPGSDNDGRIEPGETIAVQVTLRETGGAAPATGVSATASATSPQAPVLAPGPVSFGAVPAGGTAPGAGSFHLYASPAIPCGTSIPFTLSMTGDQGCWAERFSVTLDGSVDCAPKASSFVEVVPGSAQIVSSGGDADGIADNCETTTVSYQVRNAGTTASGAVTALAESPHPGVTLVPDPAVCSLPGLAGGAVGVCQFSFSLGGASMDGVPFTLTADAPSNAAPHVAAIVVDAENDPHIFGTRSYGFEGSFEGWSSQQFVLSSARAAAGTQSARAGTTAQGSTCAKLTSPPLLVQPGMPSTLTFSLFAMIEPFSDQWYDRANVHVIDQATGVHSVISPSAGTAYNAGGNVQVGTCHNPGELGWAGLLGGFSTVTFDLSPYGGRDIRIEINYGSDDGDHREGIYVDQVSITHVADAAGPGDPQPDGCAVSEVSAPAAAVPLHVTEPSGGLFDFTWEDRGPGFQYNLYAGSLGSFYSHGAGPLSCAGVGSSMTCDGTACGLSAAAGSLPPGDLYFLVTGTAFGAEGTSGSSSGGAERSPAQSTCAP
ncbi:MAG TPA: hypothetical protein VJV23_07860 [Candidatus Polarisedimenticolia bacterium]|nr:hypothetical protein [Candidatus Polarisedimenticolia bacterium]